MILLQNGKSAIFNKKIVVHTYGFSLKWKKELTSRNLFIDSARIQKYTAHQYRGGERTLLYREST